MMSPVRGNVAWARLIEQTWSRHVVEPPETRVADQKVLQDLKVLYTLGHTPYTASVAREDPVFDFNVNVKSLTRIDRRSATSWQSRTHMSLHALA